MILKANALSKITDPNLLMLIVMLAPWLLILDAYILLVKFSHIIFGEFL